MQEDGNVSVAMSDRRNWRGYAQIALVVLVLAVALYFARAPSFRAPTGDAAPQTSAPPVVAVVVPLATEQALTIDLTGTVSAREKTTLMTEVEGRVAWVSPDLTAGGFIAAGETIVRIDPAQYELDVEEVQATVEEAEARVRLEEALGVENERVFEFENPDSEPSEWVRRLPHIALAQAELKKAQVALRRAELQLARTEISLPYDVRVMGSDAAVGELARPEDPPMPSALVSVVYTPSGLLGLVYRPHMLRVITPIEPRELAYLEPAVGRKAQITGRTGSWEGEIASVSSIVDATSGLASVFIKFAEDEHVEALPLPGTFVEINIEGPVFSDVYVLPNTVPREDGSIWIVRNGRLQLFKPEAYGRTADGWVVKVFDAGEGIVADTLSEPFEGLAVSPQVLEAR